jgi:N-acetylglucosaminyl-diphospho-decaprenol L-rhamnosyltransferase
MTGVSQLSQVSVIVTHYRSPEDLAQCLSTLARLPGAHHLEVLVADSDAEEGTAEVVRRHHRSARYIPVPSNCGYAALVNIGMTATARPFMLVINADIILSANTIPELLRHLLDNPDVGIVGPALNYGSGAAQVSAFAFYRPHTILCRRTPLGRTSWGRSELKRFELFEEASSARATGRPIDVDWLMGAVVLVRRSAVLESGRLDERYFLYFEDVEWCLQFWRKGWRVVYLPTVSCTHRWSRASHKGGLWGLVVNPLTRRHLRSCLRFFRRNGLACARPDIGELAQAHIAASIPRQPSAPRPSSLQAERAAS